MLLDPERRRVVLAGGRTLRYRHCLLATGAEPTRPAVPGVDDPGVRVLRSLDDLHALVARLPPASPVVVVGSGFLGCEVAVSLRRRGHPVSLISAESAPNCLRLGVEAGEVIARWLREEGVDLTLAVSLVAVERHDEELLVLTDDDHRRAPVVLLATGVAPRSELVRGHGLTGEDGAVPVDSSMRTAADGLFAAGDVASADNPTAGRPLRVEHWGDAVTQGRIAGEVAAGGEASWRDVPGFWSTIGTRTLKYVAWGDGYDRCRMQRTPGEDAFSVWYGRCGRYVGVLAHDRDDDLERGRELIVQGAPWT
jgi:3-phenylpropionate/trans-cinnamate dioxygenase ferredoxin reductase component